MQQAESACKWGGSALQHDATKCSRRRHAGTPTRTPRRFDGELAGRLGGAKGKDVARRANKKRASGHHRASGCREHHHGRADRHERERNEERDHDPGGLVDQGADTVARDERELVDAEAGSPGLRERHVEEIRVLHPEQHNVDRTGSLADEPRTSS